MPTKEPCRCRARTVPSDSLGLLDWIDILTGGFSRGWAIWTTAWWAFGLGWVFDDLALGLSLGLSSLIVGPLMYGPDKGERR